MERPRILITDHDFVRLAQLVKLDESRSAEALEEELARASIVSQKDIPNNIVTMNSKIRFVTQDNDTETEVTLVFPKDADVSSKQVSVLAPIGTALLGLQVGQTIEWAVPSGSRRLKVVAVPYQPEASGDWER